MLNIFYEIKVVQAATLRPLTPNTVERQARPRSPLPSHNILPPIATALRPGLWPMNGRDSAFNPRHQWASFPQTLRMRVRGVKLL